MNPIDIMDQNLRTVYYYFSQFDFCAKYFVYKTSFNLKDIVDDKSFKKKFEKNLQQKYNKNSVQYKRCKMLLSLIHDFLHADFKGFLKKAKLLKNEQGMLVKLNAPIADCMVPLAYAKEDELYAWRVLLAQNARYSIDQIFLACNDLCAVCEILTSSNIEMYFCACMKAFEFEIQFRILTSKLGIKTFGTNMGQLLNTTQIYFPHDNLSIFELCIFVRNKIRHLSLINDNLYCLIRISSLIDAASSYIKNNQSIMKNMENIIKISTDKDENYYKCKLLELKDSNLLNEWIADFEGWHNSELILNSGISFIDCLLYRIDLGLFKSESHI
jgi:hypothetical protein